MAGLDVELELVAQAHAVAISLLVRTGLVLGVPAVFLWWIRKHGAFAVSAIAGFALTGVLSLAFTLAAASGAIYSMVVHLPSVLRLQIAANEWETIDALRRISVAATSLSCDTIPANVLPRGPDTAEAARRRASSGPYPSPPRRRACAASPRPVKAASAIPSTERRLNSRTANSFRSSPSGKAAAVCRAA